jgi:glyoxylase-like metal-dependent hydrolase (beta-lactamase superfamily II)
MRAIAYGGFGEKGRTSIAIEEGSFTLLLDCGVNISNRSAYCPEINPEELAALDAMLITHAHEDHIAAVGWALANGFKGRLLMTRETQAEAAAIWKAYTTEAECRLAMAYPVEHVPARGSFELGPFCLATGRSGHIVGGVWCHASSGGKSALYCGDVVPASPVFSMDPLPRADLVMLDASYGDDQVSGGARFAAIRKFLSESPGCVLPTPLIGRSLEMLALIPQPIALAPGMREGLVRQISEITWLKTEIIQLLRDRLAAAIDWTPDQLWSGRPVLCHDGMGMSGPSADVLARAVTEHYPVLFTGHVPKGSLGDRLMRDGAAQWLRFPTHPTLAENCAFARECGASLVLAHSCAADMLPVLAHSISNLNTAIRPRGSVSI